MGEYITKDMKKDFNNKYTWQQVDYAFAGMDEISDDQRMPLAKALSVLDKDLVDKIADEIIFISSNPDTFAFCLPLDANHLRNKKGLIFLSESVFRLNEGKFRRTILHEVAHYILKHKCIFDFEIGDDKMDLQEEAADKLVEKWLKKKQSNFRMFSTKPYTFLIVLLANSKKFILKIWKEVKEIRMRLLMKLRIVWRGIVACYKNLLVWLKKILSYKSRDFWLSLIIGAGFIKIGISKLLDRKISFAIISLIIGCFLIIIGKYKIRDKKTRDIVNTFFKAGKFIFLIVGFLYVNEMLFDPHITIEPYRYYCGDVKDENNKYEAMLFFKVSKSNIMPLGSIDYNICPEYAGRKSFNEGWYRNYVSLNMDFFERERRILLTFPAKKNEKEQVSNGSADINIAIEVRYKTLLRIREITHFREYKYIHNTPKGKDQFVRIK